MRDAFVRSTARTVGGTFLVFQLGTFTAIFFRRATVVIALNFVFIASAFFQIAFFSDQNLATFTSVAFRNSDFTSKVFTAVVFFDAIDDSGAAFFVI